MAEIGGTLRPAVDARALHPFLGVKQDFLVWVKNSFIEELDFLPPQMGGQENAGLQTTIDYHLSLDMANVLAMVEKSDQGRAALLVRTGQTRPEAPLDAGKAVPLPADRMPVLLAVLVALGVFWRLAFSCHGP
jgi:phage anti-repressor protein